jgi:hypothetical protein
MKPSDELQDAYDEVLKKIGRNLLIFQQAEHLLKLLLTWGSFRTTPDKPAVLDDFAKVWNQHTMGQLKSQFVDRHCTKSDDLIADFNPENAGMAMSFTLGNSDGYAEQRGIAMDMLVAERNDLVHHLILRLQRDSLESCREISAYLDAQREKVLPEIQQLKDDCKSTREMMVQMISFLMSDEGMSALEKGPIRQCPLITNLAAIAAENPDPMAWTPLKSAISRLQDFPSEKISDLVGQFGQKSLTRLLDASELFELKDEQCGHGRHRTLYRLKSGIPSESSPPA